MVNDVTGDNEKLEELARKLLETYDFNEILERNDLHPIDVLLCLLESGLIDEMIHVL